MLLISFSNRHEPKLLWNLLDVLNAASSTVKSRFALVIAVWGK